MLNQAYHRESVDGDILSNAAEASKLAQMRLRQNRLNPLLLRRLLGQIQIERPGSIEALVRQGISW